MALSTTKKLTLSDVHTDFTEYNFLIFTNMGTIDTSEYNLCKKIDGKKLGNQTTQQYLFARTSKDELVANEENEAKLFEKAVILYENKTNETDPLSGGLTIERIQVKSKRDFLGNQYKNVKKLP